MKFIDALSVILEDTQECAYQNSPIELAMDIVRKIDALKSQVLQLQNELIVSKNQIKGDFALEIKKSEPAFNVNLDSDDACKIGCLDKTITIDPNLQDMRWEIDCADDEFAQGLMDQYPDEMILTSSVLPLVAAVKEYYANYGKTIGESLKGRGVILVEGKIGTLSDLVRWRQGNSNPKITLPSRAVRGKL